MKIEYHFLLTFIVLVIILILLHIFSDCKDYLQVANTKDPRVDRRPIWLCHDENDKTSRIRKIYHHKRKLQSMGILDKWSITHTTHALIIFPILLYLNNYKRAPFILYLTLFIEFLWEIFENTSFIINKYRRSRTLYRDYSGDSIANMVSDILFTLFGVMLIWYFPIKLILVMLIFFEVFTYVLIDDNILINIYSLTVA